MRPPIPVGSRSLFVTTTAWTFILLAGLASATALVQNAVVASMLPLPAIGGLLGFLLRHLLWVVEIGLLVSLATLACAIGLLLRLDWARRSFIALLALAIAAQVLSLWLQHEATQLLLNQTLSRAVLPSAVQSVVGQVLTTARLMAALVTLGGTVLLAWIIRRLMSSRVRCEFA